MCIICLKTLIIEGKFSSNQVLRNKNSEEKLQGFGVKSEGVKLEMKPRLNPTGRYSISILGNIGIC